MWFKSSASISGSLLSQFIEPIYLDSLILGSLYHKEHLARALFGRLSGSEGFPEPYRTTQPFLSGISNPESRQIGKAPNFAISWCVGDPELEVINTTTGKTEPGPESHLCKRELFKRYLKIQGRVSSSVPSNVKPTVYHEAKELCEQYKEAKEALVKHFKENGYGQWVKKPIEQDSFTVEEQMES